MLFTAEDAEFAEARTENSEAVEPCRSGSLDRDAVPVVILLHKMSAALDAQPPLDRMNVAPNGWPFE